MEARVGVSYVRVKVRKPLDQNECFPGAGSSATSREHGNSSAT